MRSRGWFFSFREPRIPGGVAFLALMALAFCLLLPSLLAEIVEKSFDG